jgi:hypothetical protein
MIQHHQGAVVMVEQLFATDGAAQDNEVFKLASDVHVDQVTEIARMQKACFLGSMASMKTTGGCRRRKASSPATPSRATSTW